MPPHVLVFQLSGSASAHLASGGNYLHACLYTRILFVRQKENALLLGYIRAACKKAFCGAKSGKKAFAPVCTSLYGLEYSFCSAKPRKKSILAPSPGLNPVALPQFRSFAGELSSGQSRRSGKTLRLRKKNSPSGGQFFLHAVLRYKMPFFLFRTGRDVACCELRGKRCTYSAAFWHSFEWKACAAVPLLVPALARQVVLHKAGSAVPVVPAHVLVLCGNVEAASEIACRGVCCRGRGLDPCWTHKIVQVEVACDERGGLASGWSRSSGHPLKLYVVKVQTNNKTTRKAGQR